MGDIGELIRTWRPELEIRSLEPLAEGEFCRAYLLNGNHVVRVPKHEEAERALALEACVLSRIGNRLPLAVPAPTNVSKSSPRSTPFSIHEKIPGEALTPEVWQGLPEAVATWLARELGGFLAALHGLDPALAKGCGVNELDHEAETRGLIRRLEGEEGACVPDPVRRGLLGRFRGGVERAEKHGWSPAILHADVSPEHVRWDPEAGALTGIIDWGDVMIGDPARDFIFLYEDWGSDFLERALEGYGREEKKRMHARAHLRYLADQLRWTLEAGKAGRTGDVRHGVAELRRALQELNEKEDHPCPR